MGDLKTYLDTHATRIMAACNDSEQTRRLVRDGLLASARNKAIHRCSAESVLLSLVEAATLGLSPNLLGDAHLVPYSGTCTFQIGYQGMIKLAKRSGEVLEIRARCVHANDTWSVLEGSTEAIEVRPAYGSDRGPFIFAYAVAVLAADPSNPKFEIVEAGDIEQIRRSSTGSRSQSSPWNNWFEEMAKKSAIKRLCKTLSMETYQVVTPEGHVIREAQDDMGGPAIEAPIQIVRDEPTVDAIAAEIVAEAKPKKAKKKAKKKAQPDPKWVGYTPEAGAERIEDQEAALQAIEERKAMDERDAKQNGNLFDKAGPGGEQ